MGAVPDRPRPLAEVSPIVSRARKARHTRLPAGSRDEGGFSLIDVLIGIVLLATGVLATFSMLSGASAATGSTAQREAATNLAREVMEGARAVPYWQVTPSALPGILQALPPLASTSAPPAWTVVRRATTFTLLVGVCSVDDARDGLGVHDSGFCADGPPGGSSDRSPVDGKRVSVDVTWTDGDRRLSTGLTGLISPSALSDAPSAVSLAITSPGPSPITLASAATVSFSARTTGSAAGLSWALDGTTKGDASGSGTDWAFSWPITDVADGTYEVSATPRNAYGTQGAAATSTVSLNRRAPAAPAEFIAGRNGAVVEAQWLAVPDGDVEGYRVLRGTSAKNTSVACPMSPKLSCVDANPPAPQGTPFYYWVVAVDRDPSGALRDGSPSAVVDVNVSNRSPFSPSGLSAVRPGDGTLTLSWNASKGDQDRDDEVAFYRVYRDGTAIANRIGRTGSGLELSFTDPAPGTGPRTYYVSAVDTRLAESALVGVTL